MKPDPEIRDAWLRGGQVPAWCVDCGVDTWEIGEYYVVQKELWEEFDAGPEWWDGTAPVDERGCLCIGCLEERMGRRLTREDFTDNPVMYDPGRWGDQSARLRDRLSSHRGI